MNRFDRLRRARQFGRMRNLCALCFLCLLLAACGGMTPRPPALRSGEGHYVVGQPYEVNGVWYYPRVNYHYDKVGIASWYGASYNGRPTADGEIYDTNKLTAAHPTLPLPSVVTVTNLRNGRSLNLRVNDRGPFADGRIIDVSRRAAQLLGFERQGTAPVQVKVLKRQSIEVAEAAMRNGGAGTLLAANSLPASVVGAAPEAAAPPHLAARPLPAQPLPAQILPGQPPPAQILPGQPPPAQILSGQPPPPQPLPAQPLAAPPPRLAAAAPPPPIAARPVAKREPRRPAPLSLASLIRQSLLPSAQAAPLYAPLAPWPRPAKAIIAPPARGFFIQAGAFADVDNAERLSWRIARFGAAKVTAARIAGRVFYRVRVGPFGSLAEAHETLARILARGYRNAEIVGN